jgi:hypothetical protein
MFLKPGNHFEQFSTAKSALKSLRSYSILGHSLRHCALYFPSSVHSKGNDTGNRNGFDRVQEIQERVDILLKLGASLTKFGNSLPYTSKQNIRPLYHQQADLAYLFHLSS